jgi:hypothetical protein
MKIRRFRLGGNGAGGIFWVLGIQAFHLPRPFWRFRGLSGPLNRLLDRHRKPDLASPMMRPVREPGFPSDDEEIMRVVAEAGTRGEKDGG